MFSILTYPVFWYLIWYLKGYFIAIIVSSLINQLIDGYLTDYSYEKLYCKRRTLADLMDIAHFFLSIFGGIGSAFSRFIVALTVLLISQSRLNEPCLPHWFLKIMYLDNFHLAYVSYIYNQHVHSNPIQNFVLT